MYLPQLKQIFPTEEDSVLQSALQSSDFNFQDASEIVLARGKHISFCVKVK
jgi:hypothetical protein